ncbi:MAG: tetratricopeptide repeat protein, partial [Magnetococcales bacterium]|nr:tetratricopeptide repeat protein [Magnetococcales bacterium]
SPPQGASGDSEAELLAMVQSVHCHARTLALLGPQLARHGVPKTTEALHTLMAGLEQQHPGKRERSLYAGVALSLNRLTPATRRLIRPLGVFQGGGHLGNIAHVLNIPDRQQLLPMVAELAQTGLCDVFENGYLRFHFALAPFLWGELTPEEQASGRTRWLEGEWQFAGFLAQQRSKDPERASDLALLDLPNQMAALEQAAQHWPVDQALRWISALADVLQNLGKRSAQQRVAELRETLVAKLGTEWSRDRYLAEAARVDYRMAEGHLTEAREAALALLERCRNAGENAYEHAAYDLALACLQAGRLVQMSGSPAQAIPLLEEAQRRFQQLGKDDSDARRMAAGAIHELGDCLRDLGQLDKAVAYYEQAIEESEQEGDPRGAAVSRGQLGRVYMLQQRYAEALTAYEKARETFARLKEPASVASIWHQIAMVYREMQAWQEAEAAYQQSLKIRTSLKVRSGIAATLGELGTLYNVQGRWEEAVVYYRQAAEHYQHLHDDARAGLVLSNLANTLLKLNRLGEAREEIDRAIQLKRPFGLAVQPWTSYNISARIEAAAGHGVAAAAARRQAQDEYARYRRQGGESYLPGAQWCQTATHAIQQGAAEQALDMLTQGMAQPDLPAWARALIPVLCAILEGSRDPALADAPGLDYDDAVEVALLLERL